MKLSSRFGAWVFLLISLCFVLAGCYKIAETPTETPQTQTPGAITEGSEPAEEPTESIDPSADDKENEDKEEKYQRALAAMTMDEKIGQLMIVGYIDEGISKKWIIENKIGGFVLFKRSYNNFSELYSIIINLKSENKLNTLPLFIALDEEGGTVSRLPEGKTPVPGARKVGTYDKTNITKETGRIIGIEMSAAGANLDLAPVVDIAESPLNKLMFDRSYGSDADTVSRHSKAFLQGLSGAGIFGCAKHFPGHGDTVVDSHKNMPVINKTLEEWRMTDALPFNTMISAGVDFIMAGHLAYPAIDSSGLPATMSSVFLTDILREDMGFEGLIITDDVEMLGYPQGDDMKEAVITSFLAGVDIFCVGQTLSVQQTVLEALKDGAASGRITEEQIDASVLRIIRAKEKLRSIPDYSLAEAKELFGSKEHSKAIADILD